MENEGRDGLDHGSESVEGEAGPVSGAEQEAAELHAILDLVGDLERQLAESRALNRALKEELAGRSAAQDGPPTMAQPAAAKSPVAPGPVVDWREIPVLGIPQIDGDHRALVGFIERLGNPCRDEQGGKELFTTLRWLVRYAERHFAREEELMEQMRYPGRAAHREDHDLFMERLFHYNAKLDTEGEGVAEELLAYLQGWLKGHVIEKDELYVSFATSPVEGRPAPSLRPRARVSS